VEPTPALHGVRGEEGQAATWIVDRISRVKRRCDVAGQYGLQGFILILPQTDEKGATGCCRRLRTLIEKNAENPHPFDSLNVHFGIASFSSDARSVKSLLSRAESQLEHEKGVASAL
jgi:diguanylate cyclase (GGDEF)-like protein